MASYAKGHTAAFECLYLRHKGKLFGFLRRQCHNHAIAEELAHDAWIAVINQATNYTSTAKFTTWLFRIAHNRLVDHWRKHANADVLLIDDVIEQLGQDSNIERGLEIEELLSNLTALPTNQIEALLLKIEGFSHSEIAEITNTKQETVKSRLRYATAQLRATAELRV